MHLPTEFDRNKVIIVTDESVLARIRYTKGEYLNIPEDKSVVLIDIDTLRNPQYVKSNMVLRNIIDSGLDQPGSILIRNPYKVDEYFELEDSLTRIPKLKHDYLLLFCGLLGARRAKLTAINNETEKKTVHIGADLEIPLYVSGGASYSNETEKKLFMSFSIQKEWSGANADIKKAENFIRERKLINDEAFSHLLFERKENISNPISKYSVKINISSDLKKSLSVLSKIEFPSLLTSTFNVDYKKIVNHTNEYILEFDVCFG